ncbi:hypothetical protein GLIP_1380 [Aliiglaciecola lipolytica E3]|uniref:HTH marR-type domain-containing protein n=2 Tax=Aliiglaciecola TaxID=1406885 RepID=K6XQQ4_9ALTE|nr:hypothetical protein GLIP_1380 [Aliiglaciecola lipolytica E3]
MQQQWKIENPSMLTDDMALVGRLLIVSHQMNEAMEATLVKYDIKLPSYGVLSALLRAGAPHALTPNQLLEQTLITSGAMTNRINKLENKGLVKRIPSKKDKRSFKVALTRKGKDISEKAVNDVNKQYQTLTSYFAEKDKAYMNNLLRGYLESKEKL